MAKSLMPYGSKRNASLCIKQATAGKTPGAPSKQLAEDASSSMGGHLTMVAVGGGGGGKGQARGSTTTRILRLNAGKD